MLLYDNMYRVHPAFRQFALRDTGAPKTHFRSTPCYFHTDRFSSHACNLLCPKSETVAKLDKVFFKGKLYISQMEHWVNRRRRTNPNHQCVYALCRFRCEKNIPIETRTSTGPPRTPKGNICRSIRGKKCKQDCARDTRNRKGNHKGDIGRMSISRDRTGPSIHTEVGLKCRELSLPVARFKLTWSRLWLGVRACSLISAIPSEPAREGWRTGSCSGQS
jgi:hypothetical protein